MSGSKSTATRLRSQPSLLTSAQAFLIEALRTYGERRVQFAIVHAVTAVELALKERLRRVNPALVRRDIDASSANEQTVALSAIPRRLANLGIPLGPQGAQLITTFGEWRNQIVHHTAAFDERQAKNQLPHLLDFLATFMRQSLDAPLEKFLPKELFKVASLLLKDWQAAERAAVSSAGAVGSVLAEACPICGTAGTLTARPPNEAWCHLCETRLYRHEACDVCGGEFMSRISPDPLGEICDDCIEAAGDQHLQQQIDLRRGK